MDQKDKSPSELITMLHAECSLKLYLRSSVFLRGHFLVQSQGTTPDQFDSFRYIANYRILQNYWEEIARYIYIKWGYSSSHESCERPNANWDRSKRAWTLIDQSNCWIDLRVWFASKIDPTSMVFYLGRSQIDLTKLTSIWDYIKNRILAFYTR